MRRAVLVHNLLNVTHAAPGFCPEQTKVCSAEVVSLLTTTSTPPSCSLANKLEVNIVGSQDLLSIATLTVKIIERNEIIFLLCGVQKVVTMYEIFLF